MRIQATIQDQLAKIVIDEKARPLYQPNRFTFTVKGIPTFWSETYTKTLIVKALNRQGLTSVDAVMSSCTLTKWNCKVSFYAPNTTNRSVL